MEQKETMAGLLLSLESETRPLLTVFDDFLKIMVDGLTVGVDMDTRSKPILTRYGTKDLVRFKAAQEVFQMEFENRHEAGLSPDVLGEFYETHLYGKGATQRFLPWDACLSIAARVVQGMDSRHVEHATADPCCGSGRLLLAHIAHSGTARPLFGIDPDPLCAKMTALNLFLKSAFIGEVMCADGTKGVNHFAFVYRLSLVPFGLIHITERERSALWHINREVFSRHPLASDLSNGPQVSINVIRFDK